MLKYVAEEIASVASNITGYAVIITDENGIIIGTDRDCESRLGTLHEASLKIISTGRQMTHDDEDAKKLKGTYPGITMPITIEEEVVGTIGIRGATLDVEKYGHLVKYIAEIMLKDRIGAESSHIKHQNVQMLTTMIITQTDNDRNRETVVNQAMMLGYNLNIPRNALIVAGSSPGEVMTRESDLYSTAIYKGIKSVFSNHQNIITALRAGEERYLVFAVSDPEEDVLSKSNRLAELLRTLYGVEAYIGIGNEAATVKELQTSYAEAYRVISASTIGMTKRVSTIEDIHFEEIIMNIAETVDEKSMRRDIDKILQSKSSREIMEVIEAWCENEFNFARTARALNIHKNTLTYRFERIKEILGIDLRDFKRTMACYLEIQVYRVRDGSYQMLSGSGEHL